MPSDSLDYPALLRRAFLRMVADVLAGVAADGLPGDHHFLLEFRTDHPGVVMPGFLRDRYPETIQIVLQHQFWDLEADEEAFSVTLRFGGQPTRLTVPLDALVQFADPTAEFALRLPLIVPDGPPAERALDAEAEPSAPEPPADEGAGGTVLRFPRPDRAD